MPRLAIISDIHANGAALDAVLRDIAAVGVERTFCLGDVVGYGPDPAYCVERMIELQVPCVLGNHDEGMLGLPDDQSRVGDFNYAALFVLLWQHKQLERKHLQWLAAAPMAIRHGDLLIVHGAPPADNSTYLDFRVEPVTRLMRLTDARACTVGHTHKPGLAIGEPIAQFDEAGKPAPAGHEWRIVTLGYTGETVTLKPEQRVLFNPGSVGQPRDANPQAAYAVIDPDARVLEFRRVTYDVKSTQDKMRRAGLPDWLADRLALGL
jgi:predicted phosphodiesterase